MKKTTPAYAVDILAKGLDVIFCGMNPAASAVMDGHNFSHPSNRFWRVLHLAGFTQALLYPQDERRLLDYHCGVTAVVARATAKAEEILPQEYKRGRAIFEAKMRRHAPRALAFLGKRALASMTNEAEIRWGRQPSPFAGTLAWVLPNPSGRNRAYTLDALVTSYTELRVALSQSPA